MNKPYPGTQSVRRAFAILKAFDDENPEWTLTDLAQAVRLNKTTTFRLLSALEGEGMVSRSSHGDGYVLGPEIIVLGGRALRSNDLRVICRKELEILAAKTGETASLDVLSGNEVLIFDEVLGGHLVSGARSIGTRWPVHATSSGLAMLAYWPDAETASFLQHPLAAITSHTITNDQALGDTFRQIRHCGYAVSDEMLELGLIAIGVPLFDHDGRVKAAISIYGPKNRLVSGRISDIGNLLRKTAVAISTRLGFKPQRTIYHPQPENW